MDDYEPGMYYRREALFKKANEDLYNFLERKAFMAGKNPEFYPSIDSLTEYLLDNGHLSSKPKFVETKANVPYTQFSQHADWSGVRTKFSSMIKDKDLVALAFERTGFSSNKLPCETQELTILGYVVKRDLNISPLQKDIILY